MILDVDDVGRRKALENIPFCKLMLKEFLKKASYRLQFACWILFA